MSDEQGSNQETSFLPKEMETVEIATLKICEVEGGNESERIAVSWQISAGTDSLQISATSWNVISDLGSNMTSMVGWS